MRTALTALVVLVLFAACQDMRECGGGTGCDLPGYGVVYRCEADQGMVFEFCFDGSADQLELGMAEARYVAPVCRPTPRHLGPCEYCCGGDCGRGCNAFQGCFCTSYGP
jgi:hypothetical protein